MTREITYAEAANEALQEEFLRDDRLVHLSTDAPGDLQKRFGSDRVRTTPISESAYVGAAIGLAGSGFRPIVNVRWSTFMFVAMDQFINQAAKITYMCGGQARFPIVYRLWVGGGMSMAAQHSMSPYAMFMNIPGLKVILPATPYDMKGLLKAAIRDNNPVLSFEHWALSKIKGPVPEEEYTVPFGNVEVKRQGTDVTVVALSHMLYAALEAAQELGKEGISVEVLDPRTLIPMDKASIRASVAKTGRLVVIDEACQTAGAAAEVISVVVEDAPTFKRLKAPPLRVCAPDVPIPYSPPMEKFVLPNKEKVLAAVRKVLR
ncbi:MAG: alpha-ketoacid dehydrogenase subunit beta [Chloroflexi bacterium]|nr:alpha-ketoacid dehydrogenase subunit beta [Chloroflexota bacterium]